MTKLPRLLGLAVALAADRKSTRLNSSHLVISYAVFCLKKKKTELSLRMSTSTTSIAIMGLPAAYANLHPDYDRYYFMHRYHDVLFSFGVRTYHYAVPRH